MSKGLNKAELLDLLAFVCDQNKNNLYEILNKTETKLTERDMSAILNVLEETTKGCFYRFIEKL